LWSDSIDDAQLIAALTDAQASVVDIDTEPDLQNTATVDDPWSDSHITDLESHRIAAEAEEEHLKQKRLERGKQPRMYPSI